MGNNSDGYSIVKGIADNTELESYRLCFVKNGTQRDITNLQWLHQQNLAREHTIYYAMQDEGVAAIYTAMPVIFSINGVKKKVLQSIDTITDIGHRGKGLFPRLAAKLYNDAAKSGFELVYGFPNENSAPGFFNKLQWISFGEAPFLLKPMRPGYFINKLIGRHKGETPGSGQHFYKPGGKKQVDKNTDIRELSSFNNDYDELWKKVVPGINVAIDRSAAYLNWRYIKKPGESYSKYGIFMNGRLVGVVVFTIKNKHNGRIGYIMELIYNTNLPETGKALLQYASAVFTKEKVDAVLAWCLPHSFNYRSFKRSGYFNLPVKFRPQHLFFGVRSFSEPEKKVIEEIQNWYISYSDSDTV